jgi:hypothetical protein
MDRKTCSQKLKATSIAIVISKTIHLHNTSRQEFLQNERWLKHEMCHIKQFTQYGFATFIIMYLWEYVKKGYYNNKFEVAAREAENL